MRQLIGEEESQYTKIIQRKVHEFGFWGANTFPGFDLTTDEKTLLFLFLERRKLLNLELDQAIGVVWWAQLRSIFQPYLYREHQGKITEAFREVARQIEENVQVSIRNIADLNHLDPNSDEIISLTVEIRYLVQIAYDYLRRANPRNWVSSPLVYEMRIACRDEAERLMKLREAVFSHHN